MIADPPPVAAWVRASGAPAVAQMVGERRVLLLFAPSAEDATLRAEQAALQHEDPGLAERDMTVVTIAGDAVTGAGDAAAALRRRHGVAPDRFALLLIGKDGHVADRSDRFTLPRALFDRIDAMPMRRQEMRARRR